MFRVLQKITKWILSSVVLLLMVLGGILAWSYHHPKETWAFIQERFLPADLKVSWQEMRLEAKHLSGFDFEFDWQIQGLQIRKDKPVLDASIDEFRLHSAVLFSAPQQKIVAYDLKLLSSKPAVFKPEPSQKPSQPQNPFQAAQSLLQKLHWVQSWVDIKNLELRIFEFRLGEVPILISGELNQQQKEGSVDLLTFVMNAQKQGKSPFRFQGKGDLRLKYFDSDQSFLRGNLKWSGFGVDTAQEISLSYRDQDIALTSRGQVDYKSQDPGSKLHLTVSPDVRVLMNDREAQLHLEADLRGLPGPVVKLDSLKADLRTPFDQNVFWSERASEFNISAPIGLFFIDEKMARPLEKSCQCKLPEVLMTKLGGKAWLGTLFSEPSTEKQVLDVRFSADSVHNKLLSLDLAADLKASKRGKEWFFKPALNTTAVVHSFQGLRQFLDAKGILIPAPLDVLEGTVHFRSQGPVETTATSYTFPMVLGTDLASAQQKVRVESDSSLRLSRDFKEGFLNIKARIADFQVELPPLDPIQGKPRVILDRRILRQPVKRKPSSSKFKLSMEVQVETERPGAVRILSPFFKPFLPLTLQINRSIHGDNSGFVRTEPFDIVYLRRTVRVQSLKIDLSKMKDGILPIDGLFRIKQASYRIDIGVHGTVSKPNIEMTSDPYLSDDEIISVLLYGRTSDELIASDAETAGGVRAAVADRAIGLFGLWAFASTPIQSFSYNPVTRVYTATVSLGGDVTAGIGTNWESATNLELRKRLSRRWVLTAEWVPGTQEINETTRLVLQWERRF